MYEKTDSLLVSILLKHLLDCKKKQQLIYLQKNYNIVKIK